MHYAWIKGAVVAALLVSGLASGAAHATTPAENLKTGQDYLADVAKKPGVVALPSGVLYRTISQSPTPGASPTVADTVTIHYEGKLISGSVFDSSFERGEPASFPLGRLIPAWQQAIPQMRVGDEILLYAPSSQAYGERDMSPDIPPNSTLIFRVRLIGIAGQ